MFEISKIMFIIVPILIAGGFVFTFVMILSPKLRGKMMSRQFKSLKYMMDESKDDLTDITTTTSNAFIKAGKNVLDENEETLREMSTKSANVLKDGIETTTRAIRKGLTEDKIYCKHCGSVIDEDSKFCKSCGKAQ